MDKGDDAESLHRRIREEQGTRSVIPVQNQKRKWIKGKYRREPARSFEENHCHPSYLVETTFSVLKQVYRESVRSRRYWNRVQEIRVRVVLYNLNQWI